MKDIKYLNIWDSTQQNKCTYINTIEEFKNYLETIHILDFVIYEKHSPGENQKAILDKVADDNNICITYTDNSHNITIFDAGILGKDIIIHPNFYNQYQDQIIEKCNEIIRRKAKQSPINLYIPDILLSDELINFIIQEQSLSDTNIKILNTVGNKLSKDQIKQIKDAHLEVYLYGTQISSKNLISNYSKTALKNKEEIRIRSTITEEEAENFIYLNENCKVVIESLTDNEPEYINQITKICNIIAKHQRNYHLSITSKNRELLLKSGILSIPNLNFTIENDLYEYPQEEFLKENAQLEELIKPIKESNLSPYEKYLAVYNIVKQFKPYKENNENKNESRNLRYILNNEYIVCVGFSKLLKVLLDKVGIPSMEISVSVDTSYDNGFTMEEIPTNIEGHARNIIKIDDPKYNINGIFIADATWDNHMELDLYNNASMTFDRKKEAKRMESLSSHDLLLDFHNFSEFTEKLNFNLRRKYNRIGKYNDSKKHNEKLIQAYQEIFNDIMKILIHLDYQKYSELHNKYHNQILKEQITLPELEKVCSEFLTEYATYILPLSNKKIEDQTILEAAINIKKILNPKQNEKELEELKEKLQNLQTQVNDEFFPYSYDPNNPIPNFLETQEQAKKR